MAPTLVAAVQQQTRVLLTLTWPGIQTATIQRLDPDGVLRNVRNAEPIVCLGSCAVFDHEAPLDQAVTYQATSPQGTGITVTDTYTRTVSNAWGAPDLSPGGMSWSNIAGPAADFAVAAGIGTQSHPLNNVNHTMALATLAIANLDLQFELDSNVSTPTGGDFFASCDVRFVNSNNFYQVNVTFKVGGSFTVDLTRFSGGVSTVIAGPVTVPGLTPAANALKGRVSLVGSLFQVKLWDRDNGTPPPAAWTLSATDTSVTGTGAVRLESFVSSSNSNAKPIIIRFDNLNITDLTPLTVTSGSVTSPSGGQVWLTHPGQPSYAGIASIRPDGLTELRPARRGVFSPIGASLPVVVSDIRSGSAGTVIVQTNSAADVTRLRNMLADGSPLLLRQPASWGGDSWFLSIGDVDINRFTQIATDNWRRWTLPYLRVDRPTGGSAGAVGQTWSDVKATYATWTALAATGKTWTALAQSVT